MNFNTIVNNSYIMSVHVIFTKCSIITTRLPIVAVTIPNEDQRIGSRKKKTENVTVVIVI